MSKEQKPSFTDDQINREILRYLYQRWKSPKSIDGAKAKVSEIQKAMKSLGISREETNRNLCFLVDNSWVREEVKESQFSKGSAIFRGENRTYRILPSGVELFQGKSEFQKLDNVAGINFENISGIVNIGNGNYIRNESVDLFRFLDELDGKIRLTDQLTDVDKVGYRAEVKTIQSQLSKPQPDNDILSKSWNVLKGLSTVASLVSIIDKIRPMIEHVIGLVH